MVEDMIAYAQIILAETTNNDLIEVKKEAVFNVFDEFGEIYDKEFGVEPEESFEFKRLPSGILRKSASSKMNETVLGHQYVLKQPFLIYECDISNKK